MQIIPKIVSSKAFDKNGYFPNQPPAHILSCTFHIRNNRFALNEKPFHYIPASVKVCLRVNSLIKPYVFGYTMPDYFNYIFLHGSHFS